MVNFNMKSLLIIGAGAFGREIHSWCLQLPTYAPPFRFKGFLDNRKNILKTSPLSGKLISSVEEYCPSTDEQFIVAVGDPSQRKKYSDLIESKNGHLATLIHPTAIIGQNVTIGPGTILAPFSLITADASLGKSVYLGPFSCISHDCVIEDFVHICGHSCLAGNVTVGQESFLSISSSVIPNIKVGSQSFIGAGSVVTRNLKPNSRVFGNPAKKLPD